MIVCLFNAVVYNAVYNACLRNAACCFFNAVCQYDAFSLLLIFANAFCFHALSWLIDTVCLFQVLFCVMHNAFNLMVFSQFYVHTVFLFL